MSRPDGRSTRPTGAEWEQALQFICLVAEGGDGVAEQARTYLRELDDYRIPGVLKKRVTKVLTDT